jgi:CDP-glucose 4,6-dehydratase
MENLGLTMGPDKTFWKNKRVLITGHTGFKGSWLTLLLNYLGADVIGLSLEPDVGESLFVNAEVMNRIDSRIIDINNHTELERACKSASPEVVFHLAAEALVRQSYRTPLQTFLTNAQGTVNLLEVLRSVESVESVICITTDKVYENKEFIFPYREIDRLGGIDPYSASKACAEIVINSYRESFFKQKSVALVSARAGNVIGGGDWSKDRLVPDLIESWKKCETVSVRNPNAIRPWQHVLDPLLGYIKLAERACLSQTINGAYNFGPSTDDQISVMDFIVKANRSFGSGDWKISPKIDHNLHEAQLLTLETSKARITLGVNPVWDIDIAIEKTMEWYKNWLSGQKPYDLCMSNIKEFLEK